jgi:hypothetical protein
MSAAALVGLVGLISGLVFLGISWRRLEEAEDMLDQARGHLAVAKDYLDEAQRLLGRSESS